MNPTYEATDLGGVVSAVVAAMAQAPGGTLRNRALAAARQLREQAPAALNSLHWTWIRKIERGDQLGYE
jgi:hypothetical protein